MSECAKGSKQKEDVEKLKEPFGNGSMKFLSSVYKVLKFEQALRDHTTHDIRRFVDSVVAHQVDDASQDFLSSSSLQYDPHDESSSELDTVLSLIVDKPFWTNGSENGPSSDGEILALLNTLLYPSPFRQNAFTKSVWNGAITRSCVSAVICEAILIDSVSDRNCFSLLTVALDSGSEILANVCLKKCLSSFLDAIDNDRDGFITLPLDTMLFLMQHDGLNLEQNEEDALAAICIWVEHDLVNRMKYFVSLFATGIRFSEIDYYSLAEMVDACDLVSYHHAATELAAHELIQKTMGMSTENALGMGTIARARKIMNAGIQRSRGDTHSLVYHTRSLLQRLIHVQVCEDGMESVIAQGMLEDMLKSVVDENEAGDEAGNGTNGGILFDEKENCHKNRNSTGKGFHHDRHEPNMFSPASSLDFMMVSPSHRSFGSDFHLPVLNGGPTRSLLDLTNLMRDDDEYS